MELVNSRLTTTKLNFSSPSPACPFAKYSIARRKARLTDPALALDDEVLGIAVFRLEEAVLHLHQFVESPLKHARGDDGIWSEGVEFKPLHL